MSSWTWQNPTRVRYGPGNLDQLASWVAQQRLALVTTPGFRRRGLVGRVAEALGDRLVAVIDDVEPNPDVLAVDRQGLALRGCRLDAIVALGGGSSIDTAKGLARLLGQRSGWTLERHFRAGVPADPEAPALPVIAIGTTAGTGAEVTPFGTIWDFELGRKYSVTGADLYPALALLDPELTVDLPLEVTLSSGLDAVSHALESAWNKNASSVTLAFSAKSLQLSLSALPALKDDLANVELRGRMMQASLLAGLAISQTRTALAHSISYPLTTAFNLPHGFACSFTLPALLRFNAQADDGRLMQLARATGESCLEALAQQLETLYLQLDLAAYVRSYIPNSREVMSLVGRMFTPGRADNNLRDAEQSDMTTILEASLKAMRC